MKRVIQQEHISPVMEDAHYPSLLKRVQSIFVDVLLLILVMFTIAGVLGDNEEIPGLVKGLMVYGFWVLYEPLCVAYGCTLGNYVMKIRVRRAGDETQRISLLNSFIRVIVKSLLGWISFLTIHFNNHKRAMHDLAAGSVVVEKN
ncbi:MAG: RDD family protein [Bacteroidota bacterium]